MGDFILIWVDDELAGSGACDKRLKKRLLSVTKQIASNIGDTIPTACEDWANTKAAYRFFSNPNISEGDILEGHFKSTAYRASEESGYLLVLHDTTEINYKQRTDEAFGKTRILPRSSKAKDGRTSKVVCGVLMHCKSSFLRTLT